LWVAPRPGVGSVADASIEASLDAVVRLGVGCSVKQGVRIAVTSATALDRLCLSSAGLDSVCAARAWLRL